MVEPVDPTLKFELTKLGEDLVSTSSILDALKQKLTAPQVSQATGLSQEQVDAQLRDFYRAKAIRTVR